MDFKLDSSKIEMCNNNILFFLVTLAITTTAQDFCQNGATCLSVHDCSGLFNTLKDLFEDSKQIASQLRRLHCGFDNDIPKICCPPEFQDGYGLYLLPNTTVCGIQTNDRIYGGVETNLDEHPWTALISYDKRSFSCEGVLISVRYVLTAAHCVKGNDIPQNAKLFQVRLGEWNLASRTDCQEDDCSPDPLIVGVEKIIPHENYNPDVDRQNDIALVRLVQDVPFTDFVRPICLPVEPTLRTNSFDAYDMEVAGWGETETGSTSEIKLKINLRVFNVEECRIMYLYQNRMITDKQLCAGGIKGKDSCRGDSGGALMGQVGATKNWMAIGITSFGPTPCGISGIPGVYTRVTEYIDWILSKLRT